jgi:hypothetical protein
MIDTPTIVWTDWDAELKPAPAPKPVPVPTSFRLADIINTKTIEPYKPDRLAEVIKIVDPWGKK